MKFFCTQERIFAALLNLHGHKYFFCVSKRIRSIKIFQLKNFTDFEIRINFFWDILLSLLYIEPKFSQETAAFMVEDILCNVDIYMYISNCSAPGPPWARSGPTKKKNLDSPPRVDRLNTFTLSGRLTVSCRATWVWSGRVSFYNRRIGILPRKTKTTSIFWTSSIPDRRAPINCTDFLLLSSALHGVKSQKIVILIRP